MNEQLQRAILDAMIEAHDNAASLDRVAKSVASSDPEVRDMSFDQARVQRSIERHLRRLILDPSADEDL